MSSGCVLMHLPPERLLLFFVIVLLEFTDSMSEPYLKNRAKGLSGDFLNFVKDMDTVVYKRKGGETKRSFPRRPANMQYPIFTTPPNRMKERNNRMLITQKAALRDVLMMKLVSYYEDKYKVSRDNPFPLTTELITRRHAHTPAPAHKNKNNYNFKNNNRIRSHDRKRIIFETTTKRRYEERDRDEIPEVLIL